MVDFVWYMYDILSTSVMIYHRGASLSEQNTDLLICHIVQSRICRTQVHVDMLKSLHQR